jgi:hypothetical protein
MDLFWCIVLIGIFGWCCYETGRTTQAKEDVERFGEE